MGNREPLTTTGSWEPLGNHWEPLDPGHDSHRSPVCGSEGTTPSKRCALDATLMELPPKECAHSRGARTSHGWRTPVAADGAGWPDLVCVKDRVLYIEFKAATGKLRSEQEEWGEALRRAGAEYYVFSPKDWADGTVEAVPRKRGIPAGPLVCKAFASPRKSGSDLRRSGDHLSHNQENLHA